MSKIKMFIMLIISITLCAGATANAAVSNNDNQIETRTQQLQECAIIDGVNDRVSNIVYGVSLGNSGVDSGDRIIIKNYHNESGLACIKQENGSIFIGKWVKVFDDAKVPVLIVRVNAPASVDTPIYSLQLGNDGTVYSSQQLNPDTGLH